MFDVRGSGGVERAGELGRDAERVGYRRRSAAERDIERLSGDVSLGKIGAHPFDTGGNRRHDGRVRQAGSDQPLEFSDELMHTLWRQIDTKDFDGDEAIAIGIESAKHGPKSAGTNLMENPEWTEGVWRRSSRSVRVQ